MKRRFFKRAISLLLVLCTLFSLTTVSFADKSADGHGTGGGTGGGSGGGTFSVSHSGYRIYLFDPNTGKRVTNVIDFLSDLNHLNNNVIADPTRGIVTVQSTKLPGDDFDASEWSRLSQSYVKGTFSNGVENGEWPMPMYWTSSKGFVGNGDSVKSWMLNNSGYIGQYEYNGSSGSGGSSGGRGNYSTGGTGIPQPTPGKTPTTTADKINQIHSIDWVSTVSSCFNAGHYTKSQAKSTAIGTVSRMMQGLMGTAKENELTLLQRAWAEETANLDQILNSYTPWPSQFQAKTFVNFRSRIYNMEAGDQKAYSEVKKDLDHSSKSSYLTSLQYSLLLGLANSKANAVRMDAGSFLGNVFNVSYADKTTGSGGSKTTKNTTGSGSGSNKGTGNEEQKGGPVDGTGNLFVILNAINEAKKDSAWPYIFYFKTGCGITPESDPTTNNHDAVTYTAWKYDLRVGVEPIWWFRPQKANGDSTFSTWFYGTPTNYAEWQSGQAAKAKAGVKGAWTDGGYGGNYNNAMNRVGASSLILTEADDDLKFDGGNHIDHVSIPSKALSHSVLQDKTKGYAMHWYSFRKTGGVPTYNPNEGDTPHPAPDPTIPDPTGDNYNVNIVKVYDYQHEDGTVEHVTTTLKTQEPGWIQIQHEPTYKVIAYFTSNDLYNTVSSETTWEQVNTVPVITGSEFSWSTVKNKQAGTNADTIKISKSATEGSAEAGATNLYVRLLKTDVETQVDYGANVISESQLNKVIGTDKRFGDDETQSGTNY